MPELPEVEAWRRQLDPLVKRSPIEQAGPAHIATLKTFDPPLNALEGEGLRGVERRAKRFLLPDRRRRARAARPLDERREAEVRAKGRQGCEDADLPAAVRRRRRAAADRGGREEARRRLASSPRGGAGRARAPRARGERARRRRRRADPRLRFTPSAFAVARPAADRRHRPRLGERDPLGRAALAVRALEPGRATRSSQRLASAIRTEMDRGLELRLAGANDEKTYRVHNKLGRPCERCGTPIARVDFEEHTIYYCPNCQTGGRVLKDRRLSRLLK